MNNDLFERLLYEEESVVLDFKSTQYHFAKATEDEKSELLKDILGFANAWRRAAAFILIGVEDVRGGRGKVIGIPQTDHLDDHSIQQFVNNLTNQPIRFHYAAFGFEGKQVGIIMIEEQIRPIYLKKDYGKLQKEKVYIRRGSSTDPTKPASLEEIAQMRVGSGQSAAELLLEFAHVERDGALGTEISWDAEFCKMPEKKMIPDLSDLQRKYPIANVASILSPRAIGTNDEFFRELADYEFARRLFRPIRLVIKNVGQVATSHVRAELKVLKDIDVALADESNMPELPKRRTDFLRTPVLRGISPASRQSPGAVSIDENDQRFRIEVDCGDLQPGRQVWSDVFYIGKVESGKFSLNGLLFADNLPQPKEIALTSSVTVKKTAMTVCELCSLPDPAV